MQLPKLTTSGLFSFMNLKILDICPSMVTTGVFGAAPPLNASCPRDSHMCLDAALMKENDIKLGPQSSNEKFGFCVIGVPIAIKSFLLSLGEIT